MSIRDFAQRWPVWQQITGTDPLGRGAAAQSRRSLEITPRTESADRVVKSVCPYCAVGCGQKIYVRDEKVVQIEAIRTARSRAGVCAPRARPASSS